MSKNRKERLKEEILTMEDAVLYAQNKGFKDLDHARVLVEKVRRYFEQGTWSRAEKELAKNVEIKDSVWYQEFIEKREKAAGKKTEGGEATRFENDGLCGKYGHQMVMVRLSHTRWYHQCRICGKRGRYRSL